MSKALPSIIFLQVYLAVLSQQCDDNSAYLQSHVKVKSDPCETAINSGSCNGTTCAACDPTPDGADIPSIGSRFPSGYLSCTGAGACQLAPAAASKFYDFKTSDDYLTCSGANACDRFQLNNVGAACYNGQDAGREGKFNLASSTCTNDVCCNGWEVCAYTHLTNVNTLSCRGKLACKDMKAELTGSLYCNSTSEGGAVGACSNDQASFMFSGNTEHCVECYGKETCKASSQFIFQGNEKVKMTCGMPTVDSAGTCAEARIGLHQDTCLHLVCEDNTCTDLTVMNYTSGSTCYCEGTGCANINMATGPTNLKCLEVPNGNANPCGASICSKSAACCDDEVSPSCGSCGCNSPPAPVVRSEDATAASRTSAAVANVAGDPHITTLDGKHYTLLRQGSFLMWAFSGYETTVPSATHGMKKVPMDFEIFTHYSGSTSFTKAILLVDKSNALKTPRQALELTSLDCIWRAKTPSWRDVGTEFLQLRDADGDSLGAFNVSKSLGNHQNVQLLMKTENGYRKIANVFVRCQPGSHMAAKVKMLSPKTDLDFVRGEVAPDGQRFPGHSLGSASKLGLGVSFVAQDTEFSTSSEWTALGGSEDAATYLKEVDTQGPGTFLKQCCDEEQQEAEKICNKHWAKPLPEVEDASASHAIFLADCVYDICAGAGEVAAQLTAEIMRID